MKAFQHSVLSLSLLTLPLVPAAPALAEGPPAAAPKAGAAVPSRGSSPVERGGYLVTIGGCNDCHTPWVVGPEGPAPDMSRMLSGHPQQLAMPTAPALPEGPWVTVASGSMTAWSGPWGVSFTANLTPDPETGTGRWSERDFIDTLRSGRHLGRGRAILPPMPWFNYGKATDEDLKAIFAYLRSIPPVRNRVPDPLPPAVAH